jgi:hypothetical protein
MTIIILALGWAAAIAGAVIVGAVAVRDAVRWVRQRGGAEFTGEQLPEGWQQ